MLSGLAAEAQLDPEFAREFQRVFIVPRKQGLVALLKRGVQRGEYEAMMIFENRATSIHPDLSQRSVIY